MRQFVKTIILKNYTVLAVVLLTAMSAIIPTLSVAGQSTTGSDLEITSINADSLPDIVLQVKGKNIGEDFTTAPITVQEDGVERPVVAEDLLEKNLQIAFVMDPTQNLVASGNTGDARWFEIASAASSLIQAGILSAQTDLLAAYGPNQEDDGFGMIEGWMRDHQAVVNTMYQFDPNELTNDESGDGALSDALLETLNGFKDEPVDNADRLIVVFSDGSKLLNTEKVNQVIDLAEELSIQLNVVMLGADTPIARGNLERLSTGTNGRFQVLNDITDLEPFWGAWQQQRTLREVTYRLGSATASQLEVSIESTDGQKLIATSTYPEFELEPAEITISAPVVSEMLSFDLTEDGMSDSDISVPVALDVSWPDERTRVLTQVDYLIDGEVIAQQDSVSYEFSLSLSEIENGEHSLSVSAIDEVGIESVASPINFTLTVERANAVQGESMTSSSSATARESASTITSESADNTDAPATTNVNDSSSVADTASSNATSGESTNALSDEAANAAVDAALNESQSENSRGPGMNLFGIQLPEQVEIFGVPFLINPVTLLIAAFPLIFALALFTYWLSQRSNTRATYATDYDFYDIGQVPTIENNIYFEDDGQLQVTQPQIGIIDIEDDITEPVKVPSFYTSAPAYLVYISGGNHLPKKLPIEGQDPIRIGRKKSFCELVLDDRRVSRLHSVISVIDGEFYIRDEGSSGGTFVNRRKLGTVDNQKLNHHDLINFNEVEYRFESTSEVPNGEADSAASMYAPPLGNASA